MIKYRYRKKTTEHHCYVQNIEIIFSDFDAYALGIATLLWTIYEKNGKWHQRKWNQAQYVSNILR